MVPATITLRDPETGAETSYYTHTMDAVGLVVVLLLHIIRLLERRKD